MNVNVEAKHLADRSDLAQLYYEPKKVIDEPRLRPKARVHMVNIFIAAMGLTFPFAVITAITIYLFRTPLEFIPFALTFFVFPILFVLIGIFYVSYRNIDAMFERLNISVSRLLAITVTIVLVTTFLLYAFAINYFGEFSLVIFLVCIDLSGAISLSTLVTIITKNKHPVDS